MALKISSITSTLFFAIMIDLVPIPWTPSTCFGGCPWLRPPALALKTRSCAPLFLGGPAGYSHRSLRRYDPGQVQRVGRYGPLSPCQEAPLATSRRNRVAGRLSTGDRYKAL